MMHALSVRLGLIALVILPPVVASPVPTSLTKEQPSVAASSAVSVSKEDPRSAGKQSLTGQSAVGGGEIVTAGNAFYRVHVQKSARRGVGLFTATTGANHPSGPGLNLLYGDGTPGTSFTTIRSYSTGTDYIQGMAYKNSGYSCIYLDQFGTVAPLGTTGFRTTYTLPGPPTTPDALTIIQDVTVQGSTHHNSKVFVTTSVNNRGTGIVLMGIRYLWDFQSVNDDGPTFQKIALPITEKRVVETEYRAPGFTQFAMTDNDGEPKPQDFSVVGSAKGSTVSSQPDMLKYACWPHVFDTAFDYDLWSCDIATRAAAHQTGARGGDSAVAYYFGGDAGSALTIAPNGSRFVSATLFSFSPTAVEECDCEVTGVTATPDPACVGDEITFTATTNGKGNVTWTGGEDPATGTENTFKTKFTTPGAKIVTATCETSSKSITVTVVTVASAVLRIIDSPLDANPNAGGGLRIFPDRQTPSDTTERHTVRARATITPVRPNVRVYFRVFDLDDPSDTADSWFPATEVDGNGSAGNDNRGDGTDVPPRGRLSAPSALTDASGEATTDLTVSRQPGNNYAIAASCNLNYLNGMQLRTGAGNIIEDANGNEISATTVLGKRTPMLTVWRRLHLEVDRMSNVKGNTITGTIARVRPLPGGETSIDLGLNLGEQSPPFGRVGLQDRFEGGTITIRSIPAIHRVMRSTAKAAGSDIVVVTGAVPTTAVGAAYELVDDDAGHGFGDGAVIPLPDTGRLAPEFARAYVEVVFDLFNPNPIVPFVLNITGDAADDLTPNYGFDNIATEASPDFWTVYVLGAMQHTPREDIDPETEPAGATLGIVDGLFGIGAHIFIETHTDFHIEMLGLVGRQASLASGYGEQDTVIHEVAHLFGARHSERGVMDDTGVLANQGNVFSNRTLRRIRTAFHP